MCRHRFLVLGCALLLCAPAVRPQQAPPAAVPTYDIELVIFRATTAAGGGEDWSMQAGRRSFAGGTGESGGASAGSPQVGRFVRLLPASQHQLTDVTAKLRASGRYLPVAHVAWSQTPSAWGSRAGFSLQRLGVDVPGLTGLVYLERGRFLHLGMALDYAMPEPPAGLGAEPGTTFSLNELRRVRFREHTYYDHPAFGVIAVVTPTQGARPPGA